MSYGQALKRDRLLVIAGIAVLATLAWAYTVYLSGQNASLLGAMAMPAMMRWSVADVAFMLVMWAVMMFAMCLTSAHMGQVEGFSNRFLGPITH